jgi:hypothetical protein
MLDLVRARQRSAPDFAAPPVSPLGIILPDLVSSSGPIPGR